VAPGGIEPPHADSKGAGRSVYLQGKVTDMKAARHHARHSRVSRASDGRKTRGLDPAGLVGRQWEGGGRTGAPVARLARHLDGPALPRARERPAGAPNLPSHLV
jgi:hypothetical protein